MNYENNITKADTRTKHLSCKMCRERILSYNIGLGLHDILYASKIYNMLKDSSKEIDIIRKTEEFWI